MDTIEKDFISISNFHDKNEKAAWARKKRNLEALIAKLEPIEAELSSLFRKKQKIIDDIANLRAIMVADCIHPYDHLVHATTHVRCKFCDAAIYLKRTAATDRVMDRSK